MFLFNETYVGLLRHTPVNPPNLAGLFISTVYYLPRFEWILIAAMASGTAEASHLLLSARTSPLPWKDQDRSDHDAGTQKRLVDTRGLCQIAEFVVLYFFAQRVEFYPH